MKTKEDKCAHSRLIIYAMRCDGRRYRNDTASSEWKRWAQYWQLQLHCRQLLLPLSTKTALQRSELSGNGAMSEVSLRRTNFISEKLHFRFEFTNSMINVFPVSKHHVTKAYGGTGCEHNAYHTVRWEKRIIYKREAGVNSLKTDQWHLISCCVLYRNRINQQVLGLETKLHEGHV
jgi:hypothetical protein